MACEQTIGGCLLNKGEDLTLRWEILVSDTNLTPVNIAGWSIRFVVKARDSATTAIIDKPCTVSGTYNAVRASNTQRAVCVLTDTDLGIAAPKEYRYSLKRLNDGFEKILRKGDFLIELATQT